MALPDRGIPEGAGESALPQPAVPTDVSLGTALPPGEVREPSLPDSRPAEASGQPAAASEPTGLLSSSAGERHRARYLVGLFKKLQPVAEVPMPAQAINKFLGGLPWEYTTEGVNPQTHYLTRQAMSSSVELKPLELAPARSIERDDSSLRVKIEGDSPRGKDLMTVVRLESQYPYHLLGQDMESGPDLTPQSDEAAAKFREADGIYLQDGDVLTDKQAVVLSYMTSYGSRGKLIEALGATPGEFDRLVQPLCDRLGIETGRSNSDAYIEMTLVAMALEAADVDHLSKAPKGEVEGLRPHEVDLLAKYYSFDPEERRAFRESKTANTLLASWSEVYQKISMESRGQDSRHAAVLYAVRNDILELPDASTIREMLA